MKSKNSEEYIRIEIDEILNRHRQTMDMDEIWFTFEDITHVREKFCDITAFLDEPTIMRYFIRRLGRELENTCSPAEFFIDYSFIAYGLTMAVGLPLSEYFWGRLPDISKKSGLNEKFVLNVLEYRRVTQEDIRQMEAVYRKYKKLERNNE